VAVISLAGIVHSESLRVGGDEMDDSIIQYLRRTYNLLIGERSAEEIKIKIGSAYPLKEEMTLDVRGRDQISGLPKTITITSDEVREAMKESIGSIVDSVRLTLERTPPELAADLVDRGMVLAGGGSLLRGLDSLLHEETGLPVTIADDPLTAIVLGTGIVLDEIKFLKRILADSRN